LVQVPYCVVYDLRDDKIAALRAYIPIDLFAQELEPMSCASAFVQTAGGHDGRRGCSMRA